MNRFPKIVIEPVGSDSIRVIQHAEDGSITDIWEGPARPLLGWVLHLILPGQKLGIRKVQK